MSVWIWQLLLKSKETANWLTLISDAGVIAWDMPGIMHCNKGMIEHSLKSGSHSSCGKCFGFFKKNDYLYIFISFFNSLVSYFLLCGDSAVVFLATSSWNPPYAVFEKVAWQCDNNFPRLEAHYNYGEGEWIYGPFWNKMHPANILLWISLLHLAFLFQFVVPSKLLFIIILLLSMYLYFD